MIYTSTYYSVVLGDVDTLFVHIFLGNFMAGYYVFSYDPELKYVVSEENNACPIKTLYSVMKNTRCRIFPEGLIQETNLPASYGQKSVRLNPHRMSLYLNTFLGDPTRLNLPIHVFWFDVLSFIDRQMRLSQKDELPSGDNNISALQLINMLNNRLEFIPALFHGNIDQAGSSLVTSNISDLKIVEVLPILKYDSTDYKKLVDVIRRIQSNHGLGAALVFRDRTTYEVWFPEDQMPVNDFHYITRSAELSYKRLREALKLETRISLAGGSSICPIPPHVYYNHDLAQNIVRLPGPRCYLHSIIYPEHINKMPLPMAKYRFLSGAEIRIMKAYNRKDYDNSKRIRRFDGSAGRRDASFLDFLGFSGYFPSLVFRSYMQKLLPIAESTEIQQLLHRQPADSAIFREGEHPYPTSRRIFELCYNLPASKHKLQGAHLAKEINKVIDIPVRLGPIARMALLPMVLQDLAGILIMLRMQKVLCFPKIREKVESWNEEMPLSGVLKSAINLAFSPAIYHKVMNYNHFISSDKPQSGDLAPVTQEELEDFRTSVRRRYC